MVDLRLELKEVKFPNLFLGPTVPVWKPNFQGHLFNPRWIGGFTRGVNPTVIFPPGVWGPPYFFPF